MIERVLCRVKGQGNPIEISMQRCGIAPDEITAFTEHLNLIDVRRFPRFKVILHNTIADSKPRLDERLDERLEESGDLVCQYHRASYDCRHDRPDDKRRYWARFFHSTATAIAYAAKSRTITRSRGP